MARFAAAVLVVGATLLLPPALAFHPLASSPLSTLATTTSTPATAPADIAALTTAAAPATQAVTDAALCRDGVLVTLTGWGGQGYAWQPGHAAFILPYTATGQITRQVPVYATVSETVGGLLGLLPSTHTVTKLVGFDSVTETTSQTFDLAVIADWGEEYVAWHQVDQTFLVTLPIGLPFAAAGQGVLTKVCDPSTPLLSAVPTQDTGGYQYWSPTPMADAWYVHLLGLDVHLASAQELADLPASDGSQGWALCPTDVLTAIGAAERHLGLVPAAPPPGADLVGSSPAIDGPGADVHTDGAAVAAVTPVHSGLVTAGSVLGAAILAGVLGAAAVPAALGRRRA